MKIPPIKDSAKLLWFSNHLFTLNSEISNLGVGFSLAKNPKLGLGLAALSLGLKFFERKNKATTILEGWESSANFFVSDMLRDMEPDTTLSFHGNTLQFFNLEGDTWIASWKEGPWLYWYPNMEEGLKLLWKGHSSYIRINHEKKNEGGRYFFEHDIVENLLEFPEALQIEQEIRNFLDCGTSRVLLFTGPPGTGKTCLVTLLAGKLTNGWLRVPSPVSARESFWQILPYLPLTSLILDDVDHFMEREVLLENLERARKYCPLILMTANTTRTIKGAVLRPGRVDHIYSVTNPDPILIDKLSDNIPQEFKPKLDGLFISYIQELNERCRVLGIENLPKWIDEMHERVKLVGDGWEQPF